MKEKKKNQIFKNLFLFTFGCIFGYVFETILCFFQFGHYESRQGLIYGPFNVIYGFAFMFAPILLEKYKDKPVYLFLLSFCYGGIYEYLCSWFQETFFGTNSWDYRTHFLNFDGRTSLFMMCVWAVIGFLFIKICYPLLLKLMQQIKETFYKPLTLIFTVFFIVDILLSSLAMIREQERLKGHEALTLIGRWVDKTYPSQFLDKIYPHRMEPETLKELRTNPELHQEPS